MVYVANSRNNTLAAIDLTTHSLSTIAGELFQQGNNDGTGPAARFNSPDGMAMVGQNLYLCDTNNSDIRQINIASRVVTTVAGTANIAGTEDAKGSAAHFNLPTQIASDGKTLYVADSGNNTIRSIAISDYAVKTIAGQAGTQGLADGPPAKSAFNGPRGVATDGKFVYVSDTGNEIIRKIDLSSMTTSKFAGTGEEGNKDGSAEEAMFSNPGALCSDGVNLYVLDADNHAIRKIIIASGVVSTVTQVNGHIGSGCSMSADNRTVFYSDTTENSVQQADPGANTFTGVYPFGQ
jgi:DNA-binding beta-propeller fold protein YncE